MGPHKRISGLIRRGRAIRALFLFPLPSPPPLSPKTCEDTVRSQPYARQEENFNQNLTMVVPKSQTSSFKNYEEIDFCCLSNPLSLWYYLWNPGQIKKLYLSMVIVMIEPAKSGGRGGRKEKKLDLKCVAFALINNTKYMI